MKVKVRVMVGVRVSAWVTISVRARDRVIIWV